MCGICGFTYRNKSLIKEMTNSIGHRGPDDEGFFVSDDMSMGHRRLAILDLSKAGHQPMSNRNKTLWIVHNGEIYNFQEIRHDLETKGHNFESDTDTEVIIHAYEEWGKECIEKFNGMFAFAIWDIRNKECFIVRDRLGIKPLYYMEKNGKLFFASEIKAFGKTGQLTHTLNSSAINLYFTFRFTPGTQTVLNDVKKLAPGHFLVWKNKTLKIFKYWDIELNDNKPIFFLNNKNTRKYVDEFLYIFKNSIKLRLVSDLSVGAYLSGGLDSSFIVGIMAGLSNERIKTFSVTFPDDIVDESRYANLVAEHFKTIHHSLPVDASGICDVIPKVIWHLDEPLSDSACIPTYLMSQVTKQKVTVILSGEGSDEQLAGYDKYKPLYYPYILKSFFPKSLFKIFSSYGNSNLKFYRGTQYIAYLNDPSFAFLRFFSVFLPEERLKLFTTNELHSEVLNNTELNLVRKILDRKGSFLNKLLLLDMKTWLPDDLLLKNDKMTMAHSVEARIPFLDHKLVEFLMKVPDVLKLRGFKDKFLLRKAMHGITPECIINRKKQGFTVPISRWLNDDLKDLTYELFKKGNVENVGFLRYSSVKDLFKKDLNNPYNFRQFWTVFSFLAWHKFFLKRISTNQ